MASSGIQVPQECIATFNELNTKKLWYIIYEIRDFKDIVVSKTHPRTEFKYEDFIEEFPETACRYVVLDYEFELSETEGKRNKIIFFNWTPDTANIKSKMIYASSKGALKSSINVAIEIQATDISEVSEEAVRERVTRV